MIIEEEVYLDHHGVKGMKWGVRSKRQKLAIIGVAAASYVIGSSFVAGRTLNIPLAVAGGGASAAAGAAFIRRFLDRNIEN